MCAGLSMQRRALADEIIKYHKLESRIVKRKEDADEEIRFLFRDPSPLLPAWYGSQLDIFEWGNRGNKESRLPRTGWCRLESLEEGKWNWLKPEKIVIPADYGLEKGVWFQVKEGFEGVIVKDEGGKEHVYMLTQPASHYYETMTKHNRMPVFVGEQI